MMPTAADEKYDIKILKDGTWLYQGTPITRHNMVRLFASVLVLDKNGDYWLKTPVEQGRIEVEDVPFVAVEVKQQEKNGHPVLSFRTNLDDWVDLDTDHPLRVVYDNETQEPAPYIMVRAGLEARINRPVYYELAERAVKNPQNEKEMGVWSGKNFFPIGKI